MRKRLAIIVALVVSLGLSACGPGQVFGPTLIPTPTITPTATKIPTATKTFTITPTQSLIPIPTFTPRLYDYVDSHGISMSYIPAGEFRMGSTVLNDSKPIHLVYLDKFYMDQYEVTNAQFAEFLNDIHPKITVKSFDFTTSDGMEISGTKVLMIGKVIFCIDCSFWQDHSSLHHISWVDKITWDEHKFNAVEQYKNHPITMVSWDGAELYCKWRGARLPTEAEWEKAARGNLDTKTFPWGDNPDNAPKFSNFCDKNCLYNWANSQYDDGYAETAPVGSYTSNWYGLYDMAGNVNEWVADWWNENYYANSPYKNPKGPSTGTFRVLRGGSWKSELNCHMLNICTGDRNYMRPEAGEMELGFRCVVSP